MNYTVLFCLDDQQGRERVWNALNAQILDLFNEYGVQIMSPNYEADPSDVKIVPKKDWFAAPARPDPTEKKQA